MFFPILRFVFVLLEVLVLFNIIIIVHEVGHFLAARWRGLYIEGFGVWFGKPIWQKQINGVLYSLGSIPAGGFVKLPQLAPMDVIEGEADVPREQLPPISALDKTIVALAGPLFSFGLAIVMACLVWQVGKPTSEMESTTTIGFVVPGSPAEKAGLQAGDKILEVDGHPVQRFLGMVNSVTWFVVRSEGETIPFKIQRDGKILTLDSHWIKEKRKGWGRAGLREVQIEPAIRPKIDIVEPNGPAAEAGLKPGDIVTHLNGKPLFTPGVLGEEIAENPAKPLSITVRRGEEWLNFTLQPKPLPAENGVPRARIGIVWSPGEVNITHPSPVQQIADSVTSIGNMVGALVSSKSDVKAQHFSGPVGIMRLYYIMFESEHGWRRALWFSVFFNVNLALLNMIPIPVLDGGHILLAVIEAIRRKPVSQKILESVQSVCALLLIGYMLYVTFFDVQDLPWNRLRHQQSQQTQELQQPQEAPPAK